MSTKTLPPKKIPPTKKIQSAVGIGLAKLRIAYRRVKNDSGNDFLPDLIGFREFASDLEPNLSALLKEIRHNYHASNNSTIDVPKSPYFHRPGMALEIGDRIVYQAIVDDFAKNIDSQLEGRDVVFGYRVVKERYSDRLLTNNVNQWLAWRQECRRLSSEGYPFLVNTDLVAYFEHISHAELESQLKLAGVKNPAIKLLFELLTRWQSSNGHGIPQNFDPSSVLGNFYLDPIDKEMTRAGFKYTRFVDDICVFAKTKLEAKQAMKILDSACRKKKLFLNTKKTRLMFGKEIVEFLDGGQDELMAIDYAIDIEAAKETKQLLKDLTKRVFSKNENTDRELRFLLNRLRKVKDPSAVLKVLASFEDYPQLAENHSRYLKEFVHRRPTIRTAIIKFLDSESNIFPWQEMWLLRTLFGAKELTRSQLDWLRAHLSGSLHPANMSLCICLLAKFGDNSDCEFCWTFLGTNPVTDRAVVLSTQGFDKSKKLVRCNEAINRCPSIKSTADVVKGSATDIWPN